MTSATAQSDAASQPATGVSALLEALARLPDDTTWREPLLPGDLVGRFEILRVLGRGGFGVVYEAVDRELGRKIALKTLRPTRSAHELSADWLRREAEAAARLHHPGIVTVLDAGVGEKGPWIAMELLVGETLGERLSRGPLPPTEALAVAHGIASALAHAHDRGVLHRDLKPANVFLTEDGRVKLLDLGLAHLVGTRPGISGGTPAYVAPEQARGEEVDARADVFALGAILYEALAGCRPFQVREGRSGAAEGSVPRPLPRGVPRSLARLTLRCLEENRERRPASGAAALEALRHVAVVLERPRSLRRALAVAIVGLVVGAAIASGIARSRRSSSPASDAEARVTIAVADVENRSGDADLDGLSGLLVTALQETRSLRVLTRSRMYEVLRQLGHGDVARIDEPLAVEIARKMGARALLVASAHRLEDAYSVELRAIDPVRDEYLFAARESGDKRAVLAIVDRLASRTRQGLVSAAADRDASVPPVGELVTTNLEAYRHYAAGKALEDRRLPDAAAAEYRTAISLQPDFALARYALAVNASSTLRSASEVRALTAEAIRVGDRAPLREGLLIRAWNATIEERADEARASYRDLLSLYPDDKEALVRLAELEEDPTATVGLAERALKLDPGYEDAWLTLAAALWQLDRRGDLLAAARRWSAFPPSQHGLMAITLAFTWGGDLDAALVVARRAAELSPQSLRVLADAHEYRGEYPEAEAAMRRLIAAGGKGWSRLGVALRHQGRRREALEVLEGASASGAAYGAFAALAAFLVSAGDGERARLRTEAHALVEHDPALRALVAAALAHGGDLEAAAEVAAPLPARNSTFRMIAALRDPSRARARAVLEELGRSPDMWARRNALFSLGELCFSNHEVRCAIDAFERFRRTPFAGPTTTQSWALARARLRVATLLEGTGERDRARAEVQSLLETWSRADPDLPDVDDAKALCLRVACHARQRRMTPLRTAPLVRRAPRVRRRG